MLKKKQIVLIFAFLFIASSAQADNIQENWQTIILTDDAPLPFKQAFNLHQKGKFKEASIAYLKFLEKNDKNAFAWNNLGLAQQKLKKFEVAEKSYLKAIELAPSDAHAYNNLAALKTEQGDLREAQKLYLKAISKDPDYAFTYNNLASLYCLKGQFYKAVEQYKKAVEILPLAEFYYNLGLLYYDMKKYDDMLDSFNRALKLNPEHAEIYYSLALANHYNLFEYTRSEQKEEFLKNYNKLKQVNPDLAKQLYGKLKGEKDKRLKEKAALSKG